jgi:feruloyl esterase
MRDQIFFGSISSPSLIMRTIRTSLFAGFAAVASLAVANVVSVAATDHADCSHLSTLKLPEVKVTDSTAVATATTGDIRAAHCRVNGVIGGDIKFTLLMPDDWNRKFMMGGGGGFVGTVQNQAAASVNAGYATVGTDTGHQGRDTDASWALGHPERQVNFGFLAVHRTTEVAKAIIRSYYGVTETRSYFSGCSNGGRQGLMEAQRYPDDFDGVVSGAHLSTISLASPRSLSTTSRRRFPIRAL